MKKKKRYDELVGCCSVTAAAAGSTTTGNHRFISRLYDIPYPVVSRVRNYISKDLLPTLGPWVDSRMNTFRMQDSSFSIRTTTTTTTSRSTPRFLQPRPMQQQRLCRQ
ncbi:unnamed protein product [Trichogramma brassicae]|uniref:Uncharacterized protein n=1 Tax=Trichogramma brassicae TaxID=86971 RepID=A0A6H5IVZ8_9HYME|nr:unnamed protein product [Trichogramma brassicae]